MYDAHYSINELIKDVASLQASDVRVRKTSFNDTDRLSLTLEHPKIESTGFYYFFFVSYQITNFRFRQFFSIIFYK